jgi:site-specific DNA recombinase
VTPHRPTMGFNLQSIAVGTKVLRCAIYARYSSDMQRLSSIEDQIRECRDAARRNGWIIVEECIFSDEAVSGQMLTGRDGLDQVITLAQDKLRQFDCILIDDTSRFGRNLSETLPMTDILQYLGVALYFVSRKLDSRDPNFRSLYISCGQHDEQQSRGTGEKVHRGQRGRVLDGCIGGGRYYGYRNVPVEDPTHKGLYGRPHVKEVRLEINPEEAAVVRRIFEMYAGGLGHSKIARMLNAEGVPASLKGRGKKPNRKWNACTIHDIVRNEKYHGVHVWNRTEIVRNPIAKRKEQRPRDPSEWERVEVPEWRIVSEELWTAAQAEMKRRSGTSFQKAGGLNRTDDSRQYLFSGLMTCAKCGSNFNIMDGKGPSARYGCIGHRFRGTCDNKLTILRRVLEEKLLHALANNILQEPVREQLSSEFRIQLMAAWEQNRRNAQQIALDASTLKEKQRRLRDQAENVVTAIAMMGASELLSKELKSLETQLKNLEQMLAAPDTIDAEPPSETAIREFLDRVFADLQSLLTAEPESAKQALRRYVTKLVMKPVPSDERPVYEVTGDLNLFACSTGPNDVLLAGSIHKSSKQYGVMPFSIILNTRASRRPRVAIAA